MSEEPYKTI